MNRILTILAALLFFNATPLLLSAQQGNKYRIQLHSGDFTPQANAKSLQAKDLIFQKSLFSGNHYLTVQFYSLPNESRKNELLSAGIVLQDYIPNLAYTAIVKEGAAINKLSGADIRAVFQFTSVHKTVPALLKGNFPGHAVKAPGFVDMNVVTYEKLSAQKIQSAFATLKATVLADAPVFRRFTIRIPQNKVKQLFALPFVQWVEFIDPPNRLENLPGRTLHRVNILNDGIRNLKGDNINIGIWDGGSINAHLDFSPAGRLTQVQASAGSDHSTHCSGTIMGRGLRNPLARGMAPNAKLFSFDFNGNIQSEMAAGIPLYNLAVSSHSYGSTQTCGVNGAGVTYSNTSRETDVNLNNFPYHLHCHSAGNSQTACTGGWSTITASGKSSKNNILVANITSTEAMSGSSSFGPVQDGRVKPEISAMGTSVYSTVSSPTVYDTYSGTSMATPGISGSVALLVQRYKELNGGTLPPSTLIKNIVLNTAKDLGNPGPDYKFGYGRINALQAVRIIEPSVRYVLSSVATGTTNDLPLTVPAGAAKLRVMLTWNDPAAAANANPALVNNLDLTVINGATTTLPWILDKNNPATPAVRSVDNVSNIEQVTIDNPAAGNYTMRVNGFAVPIGTNQSYALTWSVDMPYIEVTYPNGGESFNPGSTEVITWDNAGVTANQTVEYSLNNGSTWTVLSSTVPATTNRYTFAVPAANTSTALVRVSSGSLTDMSDANFKILGTVTGLAATAGAGCSSGSLNFTWNAVTNATHYDLYRLDNTLGQFAILAADITGTTYAATGLTPGGSEWFTIVAKNNTTGSVSIKAIAINATPSSGGGGLGAIGTISGQTNICGTPTNVPYNIGAVTGATTYTWTAPVGAVIASGQGTASITVNYPAGSNSGNLSVIAGNGACQTSPATLAILVGGLGTVGTISGQTNICGAPANVPYNISAVAGATTYTWTVPAGAVIASGQGTVSINVNYPAGSNSGNLSVIAGNGACQTSPGTLAILVGGASVAAPTSGGDQSQAVCPGGPVPTLTATATVPTGHTVIWYNLPSGGTVVASPIRNTIGTVTYYAASRNTASGCESSIRTPVILTISSVPAATMTAGSPTTFCQGGSVTLTANAGGSYVWRKDGNVIGTAISQTLIATAAGSYTVTVTTGSCSSTSSPIVVTVNTLPTATITASGPTSFCQGGNVVLTASAGSSWLWSNNAVTQSITVSSSGNYSVTVSGPGCSATSLPVAVSANSNISVSISAAPYRNLYPGLTTTLTANVNPPGTYNYAWFKNGNLINGATNAKLSGISYNDLGSYTVSVSNVSGMPCNSTSPALVLADSATATLFIFPSPNGGKFKVVYYAAAPDTKYTLTIYDSKGSRVYVRNYSVHAYQQMDVDMKQPGKGVYRVALSDRSGKTIAVGSVMIE